MLKKKNTIQLLLPYGLDSIKFCELLRSVIFIRNNETPGLNIYIYIREGGSKRKEQEFIGTVGCFVPGQGQWGLCCGIDLLRGRGKWLLEDINALIA